MDEEIKSVSKSKKCVGRPVDEFWQSLINNLEPWKLKAAVCMPCDNKVNYHKKIEQAKAHLQKTSLSFRNKMMAKEVMEHPSWYQSVRRSKLTTPTAKGVNKANVWSKSSKLSAAAASHFEQSSIKQYTLPKMTKQVKGKLEENLALHHYNTGSSFQKINQEHLKLVF